MVFRPQKTNFQLKIVDNIQTISIWANNPWRRYSISLIILLIGYFLGSSLPPKTKSFIFMPGLIISVFSLI